MAIKNFFITRELLKELNHTHIIVIPNTKLPNTVHQFSPISFSNYWYKTIGKILASQQAKNNLQKFISPHKSTFILGKLIQENTIVIQEIFHHLKKKRGRNRLMPNKIDMEKAFDCMEWSFVLTI